MNNYEVKDKKGIILEGAFKGIKEIKDTLKYFDFKGVATVLNIDNNKYTKITIK